MDINFEVIEAEISKLNDLLEDDLNSESLAAMQNIIQKSKSDYVNILENRAEKVAKMETVTREMVIALVNTLQMAVQIYKGMDEDMKNCIDTEHGGNKGDES